jgi:hypothetical protein
MARKESGKPFVEGPQEKLLLVEGSDDFFALQDLLSIHKMVQRQERPKPNTGPFRLEIGGGYEHLRDSLPFRLRESGLTHFGIVVDADEDVTDRWNSLHEILTKQCGYPLLSEGPHTEGMYHIEEGQPTLGIWLMPNNKLPGALEEFIRLLVPNNDTSRALWEHAETAVSNLPVFPNEVSDNWKSKARLHTWLAWQEEPGKPIGQALTKRYLDPKADEANRFLAWIRRLFDLPV